MRKKLAVTELAKMGYCETLLMLNKKHGTRTHFDQATINRGNKEHAAFDKRVKRGHIAQDTRCFIASAIYGEQASQTQQLRQWRDNTLQATLLGAWFIEVYYLCSPPIARALNAHPLLKPPVRSLLDLIRRVIS